MRSLLYNDLKYSKSPTKKRTGQFSIAVSSLDYFMQAALFV